MLPETEMTIDTNGYLSLLCLTVVTTTSAGWLKETDSVNF